MEKLIIPFGVNKESDVEAGGEFTFIGFERILKLIAPHCDLDEDEKITGLVITKDGIKIRIDTV
jgi:hypothetical protein